MNRLPSALFVVFAAFLLGGCGRDAAPEPQSRARPVPAAKPSEPAAAQLALPASDDGSWRKPAGPRVVAIGDVHGDLAAARAALKLAGAIDDAGSWVGEKLIVVQTGDQLDRGDDERKIIDLFETLRQQAKAAGGAFHVLNGNHETMNVRGDFRYVTQGGYAEFSDVAPESVPEAELQRFPASARGRAAAFLPGGSYAKKLAQRPIVIAVGDTLFAHGGVLPAHLRYGLARLNSEASAWMRREGKPPEIMRAESSPVWSRHYSDGEPGKHCKTLTQVLDALKLKRLVVGHTVQKKGITSACGERVWRIDVGMAKHYGGSPAVLQIENGKVSTLR